MALTTLIASDVTVLSAYRFGGTSGKQRKIVTVKLNDPLATSGGMTIGANTGDIAASVLGFTKIEWCSALHVYTTSTGAPVGIFPAAPDLAGTSILTNDVTSASPAPSDVTITTAQSAKITLIGY